MNLVDVEIPIDKIFLDPNNYRFREEKDFQVIPEDKFHIEVNQKRAAQKLKADIPDLVKSIKSNGFLKVERVVVAKYGDSGDYYVIEGNRRIAALKQISDEIEAGIFENQNLNDMLKNVPCLLAENTEDLPAFKESLMGIRHVGGIKEWGGFQRAQLIYEMRKVHGLDAGTVSERIGLSVQEVNRRYKAISALNQLLSDEEFGERGSPAMYPLFHEAIALPVVRDWLGWKDETNQFENNIAREQFYYLLVGMQDDEGHKTDPKLNTYQDVRALREIVPNAQAKSYLLNPGEPFSTAVSAANQQTVQSKWRDEVNQAIVALKAITLGEIESIDTDDLSSLESIKSEVERIVTAQLKLKA